MIKKFKIFENNQKLFDDLDFIIKNNNKEELLDYLKSGGDPNLCNTNYKDISLLIDAIYSFNIDMVEILIAYGADVNFHKYQTTPLITASFLTQEQPYINSDIMKILCLIIEAGADWNQTVYEAYANEYVDFLFYLKNDEENYFELYNYIIKKYPDKFKKYLTLKKAQDFNI